MRWLLAFQMVWGPLLPMTAQAQSLIPEKQIRQYVVDAGLDELLPQLNAAKKATDWEKLLPAIMSKRDREDVHKTLAQFGKPFKFKRLVRGLEFQLDHRTYTIVVDDVRTGKMRINDKVDFLWHPENPLKVQAEVLARALQVNHAAMIDLLMPEAHADWAMVGGMVIGALVSAVIGVLSKPLSDLGNAGLESIREKKTGLDPLRAVSIPP